MHKKLVAVFTAMLVGGILTAGALFAQEQTLQGTVTDAMCGMQHRGANAAACLKGCVGKGSKYALVVGDKVYELTGQEAELAKIGAGTAKVTGKVDGLKVAVSSVSPVS
jgi:hypothetical protein